MRPAEPGARPAGVAPFELVSTDGERFAARGALTFATARQACALGEQTLAGAASAAIDCNGISSSDSAGLAVLLQWLGSARDAGRHLRYANLPPGLTALAEISEVTQLLDSGV
jgi:phospholipid transport system transporter-binding protein